MTIGQLLEALGDLAPWNKAAGWDPVGLQLGDPEAPLDRVAVCHELAPGVLDQVLHHPPSLVVTYHPLLFQQTTSLVAGPGPEGRALRLARAGVAVAAVHTNFDSAPGGTADALAETLGLEEIRPFAPRAGSPSVKIVTFAPEDHVVSLREAMAAQGAGVIGSYSNCSFRSSGTGSFLAPPGSSPATGEVGRLNEEPEWRLEMVAPRSSVGPVLAALASHHPYEEPAIDVYDVETNAFFGRVGNLGSPVSAGELAELVAGRLQTGPIRFTGKAPVRTVAVVPGSGAGFVNDARAAAADALVTGDVSHHQATAAAETGLVVVDAGHTATERPGVSKLAALVASTGVEVWDLAGSTVDPWQWTP